MFHRRFLFHMLVIQLQSHSVIQKHTLTFHIKAIEVFFIKNLIFGFHQQLIFFDWKKNNRIFFFLKARQCRFNSVRKKNVYQNFDKLIQMFHFLKQDFKSFRHSFDKLIMISSFVAVVDTTHKILNTPTKMKDFETIKKLILLFKKLFMINKKTNESF